MVESWFDLRANPDLPEIYGVFLAAVGEWRQWRCHLLVSAGDGRSIDLASQVSSWVDHAPVDGETALPSLDILLEQRYHAVDYGTRSDYWDSKEELLAWLRSITILYFLDKHEVELSAASGEGEDLAIVTTVESLRRDGLIEEPEDGGTLAVSEEGRRLIGGCWPRRSPASTGTTISRTR